ncbi:hypothetical protein PDJAM_G00166460 [Pangasius djambal]|uniref:Uncharacterized protein n=1 Tax=Pangasius djambal TaxID=1691987 RepID=A0ACC5ZKK3_9TELE|nr:hypothetical protein [Pangasius djambal]
MDGLANQSDSSNGNAFIPAHRLVTRSFRFERMSCEGEEKQHRLSFPTSLQLLDLLLEMLNRILGVKKEDFQAPD